MTECVIILMWVVIVLLIVLLWRSERDNHNLERQLKDEKDEARFWMERKIYYKDMWVGAAKRSSDYSRMITPLKEENRRLLIEIESLREMLPVQRRDC